MIRHGYHGYHGVPALPALAPASDAQTRSGKIMRRIPRKIAAGTLVGMADTSTLADPAVVDILIAD